MPAPPVASAARAVALLALGLALAVGAQAVRATTISIDNVNAEGVGFNDATPATPVAGNPGTTLGEQRLNVFKRAAAQWAERLDSPVEIRVRASMTALACDTNSATLGSAGPVAAASFNDLATLPAGARLHRAYSIAEANAFTGSDGATDSDDIEANFNLSLDQGAGACLGGTTWWYGLDPDVPVPAGTIALLPVVFHELAHGLGFVSGTTADGRYLTNEPPIWSDYLYDTAIGKRWIDMTAAERAASSKDDPHLVWTGPRTNRRARVVLKPGHALIIDAPAGLAGAHEVGLADFGPDVPASGIAGTLALVDDGVDAGSDGCSALPPGIVAGRIALIDRGTCDFTVKARNAQAAGAVAVLIADDVVENLRLPLGMHGDATDITIPIYSITQALGQAIKAQLGAGVQATLGHAELGANEGCVRMFAPDPLLPGSSVSHFHADASPDLLMEPALNEAIFDHVDLTLPLFADIGWRTHAVEDTIYDDGFEPDACAEAQP
ncbi:MAG TPA: PA domain-containing protein [Rhodanobacteraceae bacterium]|nr:PA domain-containing protein [Rhodanobacteraceae bacterium]